MFVRLCVCQPFCPCLACLSVRLFFRLSVLPSVFRLSARANFYLVFYSLFLIRLSFRLSARSFIDSFLHESFGTPTNLSLPSQRPDLTRCVYTNLQDYYHSYLPPEHERSRFGEYEVTLDSVQTRRDVVVSEIRMASIKVNPWDCFIYSYFRVNLSCGIKSNSDILEKRRVT